MFGTLLESQAPRPRSARRGGVVVSVLLHAAAIGGAVAATGRAATPRRDPAPSPLIYVAPPPPAERVEPPRATTAGGVARGPAGPTAPSQRANTDAATPPIPAVPVGILLPTASAGASAPVEEFASGGLRGTTGGAGGTLGGNEAWSAAAVERAAVPRAGNPVPRYPEALQAAGVDGQVLVRFVVDTAGRVAAESVEVLRADDPRFADAVRAVLPSFRFTPAEAGGRRVRQLVEAPFSFTVRR